MILSNYNHRWFVKEDKERFTKLLDSYARDPVLLKLEEILLNRIQQLDRTSIDDYDKASWPYYQAHRNGQIATLREIIEMLPTSKGLKE